MMKTYQLKKKILKEKKRKELKKKKKTVKINLTLFS